MPSSNNFPFRQLTPPFVVPAGATASQVEVGGTLAATKGIASTSLVNAYPIWIRIVGSGTVRPINGAMTGTFIPADETNSFLIPPGPFWGIFSTIYPIWLSAIAVERPGFSIYEADGVTLLYPGACIEASYGGGS